MALVSVDVTPTAGPLPERIAAFVRAADQRIDALQRRRISRPLHAFGPTDFEQAWRMLSSIARGKLAPGRSFCEWGCGVAAVAGLAALLGFDACGIEIEGDLVDEARRLATGFGLDVPIAQGNFVPEGAGALADCADEFSFLSERGPDGHSVLGREPDDFDLVFAYPWPGEEVAISRVFERFAASGALLLTFHGNEGLQVRRKVVAPFS